MAKKVQKEKELLIELIPTTTHYKNVRTTVKTIYWDKIRKIVYKKANNKCEICGEIGTKQGFKHKLECHEVWQYQEKKKVQKLVKLQALCPLCHQAKHIGRTTIIGQSDKAYERLKKINKWTNEQLTEQIEEAFKINKERSKHDWKLDLSILVRKPYDIPRNYLETEKVFKFKT